LALIIFSNSLTERAIYTGYVYFVHR